MSLDVDTVCPAKDAMTLTESRCATSTAARIDRSPEGRTFVFVAGLHRSGTSVLFKCLKEHPAISGFDGTGAIEDEGQLLQTVYPPARVYGGPGRFGFDADAHLTETSSLASAANAFELF